MKVIIDIPANMASRIEKLISEGRYSDLEQFVLAALHNQTSLEEIEKTEEFKPSFLEKSGFRLSPLRKIEEKDLIGLRQEYVGLRTVGEPSEDILPRGPLWGQYNRIFPVKVALRVLSNLPRNQDAYVDLDEFSEIAANVARKVGFWVREIELKEWRSRGDKLSTGMPIGDEPAKSMKRFRNQFIGYIDGRGYQRGAAPKLKFVSIVDGKRPKIGITRSGLGFAKLRNPVLDDGPTPDRTLSDEEIEFYIQHVYGKVKEEAKAIVFLLGEIARGRNRPTILTERLRAMNLGWKETEAETIRSGLISRMCELRLISRKSLRGREIAYELSRKGKSLLRARSTDKSSVRSIV